MKYPIFTLFLFLALKGWGQSPAFNFSSSTSVLQPIFEVKQDAEQWQNQPASFSIGADYLVPFGKKDFVSIGIQYRQWQYKSGYPIQMMCCFCSWPKRPYNPLQRTIYKEFAIPIQFWLYSKKKPWQVFSRVGFTPSYVSNASITQTYEAPSDFQFLDRSQFDSWNFSADIALGLQRNLSRRIHAYLAVNSQLYLRKNQLYTSNNAAADYYYFDNIEPSYHKAGVGLEIGIQYSSPR